MSREGGQVRAAEAGRRGSVGHVEVFRMDGVGTSIVGRPRRLSADRRARPTYTLIWEEPGLRARAGPRTLSILRGLRGAVVWSSLIQGIQARQWWPVEQLLAR
ncbi:hypothetical protein EXE63_12060 [Mycolicibacterium frederiksbergense]|uniref:Uncharacterized protein n=1 Tax=Mycolicibacterium frederiksbergense TaxID=117567 RepID=A0A6H0S681_9MYCO|nr:hypothetical protein EXE63_12060 [Mycolicibacterium frederiksbergense]